ncbi:hypothetical protein CSE45_2693 [Citreicella sp. SE45]|nr:hypothetical protein CSE45_2693 [Citreicella sp. SE45]
MAGAGQQNGGAQGGGEGTAVNFPDALGGGGGLQKPDGPAGPKLARDGTREEEVPSRLRTTRGRSGSS